MRWKVSGADRQSGVDVTTEVEAATEEEAVRTAGKTILIERILPIAVPRDPSLPLDYRPRGAPQPVTAVRHHPVVLPNLTIDETEQAFYSDPNVTVTNARLICMGRTYAMGNVTSVQMMTVKPDRGPALALAFLGLLALFGGIGYAVNENEDSGWLWAGVGLLVLVVGVMIMLGLKTSYRVRISSNSGEVDVIKSTDSGQIAGIVEAVNRAMIARK